ncbi:uncharacterized protein LOC111348134 [Spodoptera litura]|uniref:tRNA (guanosine(18)-2'-O)-methyltransferase TARBP1 n=1 Tax=Spodoptera litura TaxID=69820 RepID=A0A9J7IIN3_SPOLT|nr:uncharacterized protein LOC111348134 [Spodoptera litura]
MDNQGELLHFLDILDLNEEVIDVPLKSLMGKSNHSNKHLRNIIQLLKYKLLINVQEGIECENSEEFDFIVKLLKDLTSDNVSYVCEIINMVLCLKPSDVVSKAEHLLQQILSNIDFQFEAPSTSLTSNVNMDKLLCLKVADSILNATIQFGEKVSLLFLETPLEKILDSSDEVLKVYFLTDMVPALIFGVVGYDILDRIWDHIQSFKGDNKENALKVLSCLSDYYLPTPDAKGDSQFVSEIVHQYNFWEIVLFGMMSDNASIRKISVYLTKKAIDSIIATKKDVKVIYLNEIIFQWNNGNTKALKTMWHNFFILIDSLEEKQANIVLPSLKLFESVNVGVWWMNSAFNMGLKHENTQVRLKCMEYKLKTKIRNETEAQILLEAINDINLFDNSTIYQGLKAQILELLADPQSFIEIFKSISQVKWAPIPLYHFTDVLANLKMDASLVANDKDLSKITADILRVPCNNVVLRRAVQFNIIFFIKHCLNHLNWKEILNIYPNINLKIPFQENPFIEIVKQVPITKEDKVMNLKIMSESYANVDLVLLNFLAHEEDTNIVIEIIEDKIKKIQEGLNRQYADKKPYLNDVLFLLDLSSKTKDSSLNNIYEAITRQNKTLLLYLLSLFSNDVVLGMEDISKLCKYHEFVFNEKELGVELLQLYKTAVLFLKSNPDIDKAVISLFIIKMLHSSPVMLNSYKHEMLNVNSFIQIVSTEELKGAQHESMGRLKNVFYEKSCAIICFLIKEEKDVDSCLNDVVIYMENVLERGGYGCLKWILKTVNKIINKLTNGDINFNLIQFVNRVWSEIEELKSNSQYSPCIEEFVQLITQDCILKNPIYNNVIVTTYCNKIIEYGPIKTNPLFYLIRKLNGKNMKEYGHLIYVLCDILLYCPVPRKDQRISDNVTLEVLQDPRYRVNKESIDVHFNYEIQYLAIASLCNINDAETLGIITNLTTIRIDSLFKNKQRYHGNSQLHRVLQTTLQHILLLVLKNGDLKSFWREHNWCLDMFVKLPHQPSVRICFEWFISLYFYVEKIAIGEEMLQIMKSRHIPLTSQFFIVYWLLKHKISNNTYTELEYNFVLDFLLAHTMGQLFNVRLNAQYLATILYKLAKRTTKYEYTINIIERTFSECNTDKNYIKLRSDYFTNDFDIVGNLTPYFIYYVLPKLCEIDSNEKINMQFVNHIIKGIDEKVARDGTGEFINEWKCCRKSNDQFAVLQPSKGFDERSSEDVEAMGTIQKKYVPWRNMSDVNVYDAGKKRESPSQLIVVASLIDKLPNLGGMARTSEVFGVQTYVVDSLRHLQDRQFQGLSVSAERWINVEEVRPGRPLKEYLLKKKEEGYAVVAAEQTSSSTKLQTFKFPKKTLLLLGHEKEGVPCDLLPLMDHCVEIPQQGYVRSLNVHVTAAIFVWEYARQNVL